MRGWRRHRDEFLQTVESKQAASLRWNMWRELIQAPRALGKITNGKSCHLQYVTHNFVLLVRLRHSHLLSALAFGSVKKLTTSLSRGAQGCLFWPILKIDFRPSLPRWRFVSLLPPWLRGNSRRWRSKEVVWSGWQWYQHHLYKRNLFLALEP